MNIITIKTMCRALLLSAAVAVGAVCLVGCGGDDNPSDNSGGSDDYVEIGGKKWMAKNLNIETADSWCYNDSPDSCAKYGRLYTWEAAKAACQSIGWHLPDTSDWNRLVAAVGGNDVAGKKLKSESGWNNNGNGTDNYGFSALPGGGRYSDGSFDHVGDVGIWWTVTEIHEGQAYRRAMSYNSDGVDKNNSGWSYGRSVRCVAD